MFKVWSQIDSEAKNTLRPDLGLRIWDSLSEDEKYRVWKYLEVYFFDKNPRWGNTYNGEEERVFDFYRPNESEKKRRIDISINLMYHSYKAKNYTKNYLETGDHFSACSDFYSIFMKEDGHAVLELLSFYCFALLEERKGKYYREKGPEENEKVYEEEVIQWEMADFNEFAKVLNDVFTSFGVKVHLTQGGFVPRQEEKITKDIFEPVIKCLSGSEWIEVNNLLSDAFEKYRENTSTGYSTCVTHTVSAVEAFLQIIVKGKTGEGNFAGLVSEGQTRGLVPSDTFTKEMFKTIISILMRERKETGDAHVKQSYASESNAKMVLNLAMVFIQHCIVK